MGPILPLLLSTQLLFGQVIFRNDFVIHHKSKRLENKGITYVTFNVGARNMWNLNAYGQPIKSITIDVAALMARREYSYREIVEKIYRPGAVFRSRPPLPTLPFKSIALNLPGIKEGCLPKRAYRLSATVFEWRLPAANESSDLYGKALRLQFFLVR